MATFGYCTTETTDLPAEASAKEGTTEGSSMWTIHHEHAGRRDCDSIVPFYEARSASTNYKL